MATQRERDVGKPQTQLNRPVTFELEKLLATQTVNATIVAIMEQADAQSREAFLDLYSLQTGNELCTEPSNLNTWLRVGNLPRSIAEQLEDWVYYNMGMTTPSKQEQRVLLRFYAQDGDKPIQGYG